MKTLFIGFDGIDGSGKGWAVAKLAERLREQGLKVWAGAPREIVGSCRTAGKDEIEDFIARHAEFMAFMVKEGYDVVLCDRFAVTLVANWGFWKSWRTPEELWGMLKDKFCDLNIVLEPPFELACQRVQNSHSTGSHLAKTPGYMETFRDTMANTIAFLRPRLGNRFVVFEDNEKAIEWAFGMVQRLRTHIDLHLTNACPLKCPTCCFAAGEDAQTEDAIADRLKEIVDAGLKAGNAQVHEHN
ncbi:MAG: hypothetical protein Q7K39_03820 [Candidatus Magasanikbacteria bacterium]|nr:hypothetical protein [Candidatus Magasanikbacteria bacterium]